MRTFAHARVKGLADAAKVPVINALCDEHHPLQALADLQTIAEAKCGGDVRALKGVKVAWIGDGNNVARSLIEACWLVRAEVAVACPGGLRARRHRRDARPVRSGEGRRRRRHRHVVLDGPGVGGGRAPQDLRAVPRDAVPDGAGGARRDLPALSAGAPRRGGRRRSDRRARVARVGRGREPAAHDARRCSCTCGGSPDAAHDDERPREAPPAPDRAARAKGSRGRRRRSASGWRPTASRRRRRRSRATSTTSAPCVVTTTGARCTACDETNGPPVGFGKRVIARARRRRGRVGEPRRRPDVPGHGAVRRCGARSGRASRGILGTVAGDDTVLVVADEKTGGKRVAKAIEELVAHERRRACSRSPVGSTPRCAPRG